MKRILPAGIALLSLLLSTTTQAAPASFTNYGDFYRSLGGSLFQGPGTDMAMPCTESPRNCVWVTSMGQALRRFDQTLWSGPGDLAMTAPAGVPEVAFDGEVARMRAPIDFRVLEKPLYLLQEPHTAGAAAASTGAMARRPRSPGSSPSSAWSSRTSCGC